MNGRISVETHACGDSSKVMQEEKEAGSTRIEKDTGGRRAALYRREERVDRRRVACRGGASRSRGPAVSGYGQGWKDRSPTAAVEAHPLRPRRPRRHPQEVEARRQGKKGEEENVRN